MPGRKRPLSADTDDIHLARLWLQQELTAAEASREFDVTPETIRKWASLGKICPSDVKNGRKLYRRMDIANCEKSTARQSGREKRDLQRLKKLAS